MERLGPYILERRIGSGGMADVFLAAGPDGPCVVKRPHVELCADREFVRMFLDEAAILARLHHPGIARIDDLGQVDGVYYLAMEYVPGVDLMALSLEHERQGAYIDPRLCARIVADAAAALHYAHEATGKNGQPLHIVHRDVTPHNILLSTAGEVKLIDFGVAKAATATHQSRTGFVKGKYPYMAPEQITGGAIDRRVDVFALGLVLYELLSNARAIAGQSQLEQIDNARAGRVRPIDSVCPGTPVALKQILDRCLALEPKDRYPTARAVADELERYLGAEPAPVGRAELLRLLQMVPMEQPNTEPILGPDEVLWRAAGVVAEAGVATTSELIGLESSPSPSLATSSPKDRPTQPLARLPPAPSHPWRAQLGAGLVVAGAAALVVVAAHLSARNHPRSVADGRGTSARGFPWEATLVAGPIVRAIDRGVDAGTSEVTSRGRLRIHVTPPASIRIDGVEVEPTGPAALRELELPAGTHQVDLEVTFPSRPTPTRTRRIAAVKAGGITELDERLVPGP